MKFSFLSLFMMTATPANASPRDPSFKRSRRTASAAAATAQLPVSARPTGPPQISTGGARAEVAPRIETDPEAARRVFGARLSPDPAVLDRSVTERPTPWVDLPKQEKKPWRPRVMLYPMGFPTGGGGLKLKIRI